MRSLANFRLSECQPRPRLGSNPARGSALHQNQCAQPLLMHLVGSVPAGITGASPVPSLIRRATSKAAIASAVTGVVCS